MRRLWEREVRQGSSVLRSETLSAMGSLRDIVSEHLAEAMDQLTPAQRRSMADAFRYLVTPSGAKIAQRRHDLAQLTGVKEDAIAAPLETLAAGDARILRPVDDSPSYELFHDVLAQPLLDWQERFHAARLQRRAAVLGMTAAAAAAIVIALIAYVLDPGWLQRAQLMTVDARFALRGDVPVERDIVIVDLDDSSLAALGGGAARIPRRLHARMIDRLRAAGAAVIAYDIEFRESTPADRSLEVAIDHAGSQLVLAATLINSEGEGEILGRPGGELSANVGYAGLPLAADGAYRQVDESVGLPAGTSARKQNDLHPTAHGTGRVMSGAEIQANAISTVRRGRPLRSVGAVADIALIVLLGIVPAVLLIALSPKLAAGSLVLAAVAYLASVQILFAAGWVLPVANPLLVLVVSAFGVAAVRRHQRRAV
jgi:CHASE2 domain-containing sensor protein